jgi:hypothetical protein
MASELTRCLLELEGFMGTGAAEVHDRRRSPSAADGAARPRGKQEVEPRRGFPDQFP